MASASWSLHGELHKFEILLKGIRFQFSDNYILSYTRNLNGYLFCREAMAFALSLRPARRVTRFSYLARDSDFLSFFCLILLFGLAGRPTHFHEREHDGKRNILLGWPYTKKKNIKRVTKKSTYKVKNTLKQIICRRCFHLTHNGLINSKCAHPPPPPPPRAICRTFVFWFQNCGKCPTVRLAYAYRCPTVRLLKECKWSAWLEHENNNRSQINVFS